MTDIFFLLQHQNIQSVCVHVPGALSFIHINLESWIVKHGTVFTVTISRACWL